MNDLKYFPQNEQEINFILDAYANEIGVRTSWIVETANDINYGLNNSDSASSIIRKCMDLIGNAVVILRIIDSSLARRDEKEIAIERVELLKHRWPKLFEQKVPEGLRLVRNDYEHFESRLDKWATKSKNRVFADMNIGPEVMGIGTYENLRRFEGETLYFWDRSVNLSEVVNWAKTLTYIIDRN